MMSLVMWDISTRSAIDTTEITAKIGTSNLYARLDLSMSMQGLSGNRERARGRIILIKKVAKKYSD